jgi:hypothetical protein
VAHIQEEIKASGAAAAADRQQRENDEFVALAGGLPEADFGKTATHPSGPRTIAWGCTQRLVEVAFHHWDLSRSLGAGGPLDPAVAGYVLPFMLDPAESPVLRALPEDAPPHSIRLTSTGDGSTWRVSVGPEGRQVEAGGAGPVEAEVSAEPGWLALALYGRTELAGEQFRCSGPAAAAFAACCR